ncbi:MAG: hypothetical protein IJ832_02265 [Bacteroidaceae bacterium]|nr:hypothetical protein [Bacteroidaceae bacterium]
MKRKIIFAFLPLLCIVVLAQDEVAFEISPNGAPAANIKAKMERNTSALLTAINVAESTGQDLNFNGISITDDAANSLAMFWGNVHFRVLDDDIVEQCHISKGQNGIRGYDIRNIAVEMKPFDDSYQQDINQEITIEYDKGGIITNIVVSKGLQQYSKILKNSFSVEDLDERLRIVKFVEQFRMAYTKKDINFMENVFSEDALIITGHKVLRKTTEHSTPSGWEYTIQNKAQYLNGLRRVFKNNAYVNVEFDENSMNVTRNAAKPYIYGVTVTQRYNSSTYSDVGKLTMIWNFKNPEKPQINVRVWQAPDDPKEFKVTDFKAN